MNEFENKTRSELLTLKLGIEAYKQGSLDTFDILKDILKKTITLYDKKLLMCNHKILELQTKEKK